MRPVLLFALSGLAGIGCLLPRLDIEGATHDGGGAAGNQATGTGGGSVGSGGIAGSAGLRDASADETGGAARGGTAGTDDGSADRSATGGGSGRGGAADSSDVWLDTSRDGAGGASGDGAGGSGGAAGAVDGSAGGGFEGGGAAGAAGGKDAGSIDIAIGDIDVLDIGIVDTRLDAICTMCNSVCVDTDSDPLHCGQCSHDCLGGACDGGRCQPITLASGYPFPHGIAVNAQYVYWTNYGDDTMSEVGSVMRVNLDGSGITILAANQDKPTGIIVTADTLYWSNYGTKAGGGGVMKMPLAVGSSPSPMATGLTAPDDLAFDSTSIYFATNTNQGAVLKQGFSDPNATPLISDQSSPFGVAVDASYLYWTNNVGGTVMRAELTGGGILTLSSGETEPWDIAVDANDVYFTTKSAIRRVPRGGGGAENLALGQSNPWGIAIDATGVYWANHNSDQIMRLAPGVNTPAVIATAKHPGYIALDARGIYWTETVNPGAVKKLAK
jgi:hypothetical protein